MGNPGKAPGYKQYTGEKHSAIRLELRILEDDRKISPNQLKVQGKIDSSQKHEENDDALNINIVKNTNASVMRRKPTCCNGGKSVTNRIEPVQAGKSQGKNFDEGQGQICFPQDFGCFDQTRLCLFHSRSAGNFRLEQMEAPDPQHGKDSQGKKNNAHSPDPLHQVSPEQDAVRHDIDILKDRSSGGGESAGAFKKRINEFRAGSAQIEW